MRCSPLQISHFFPARLGDDFLAESGRRAVFGADGTPTEGGPFVGPFAFWPFAARKATHDPLVFEAPRSLPVHLLDLPLLGCA